MTLRTALVTNASSGLGLVLTTHLLDQGYRVFGVSDRGTPVSHGNFIDLPGSLKKETDVESMLDTVSQETDVINLVVINTGQFILEPLLETSSSSFIDVLESNTLPVFYLFKHLVNFVENEATHLVVIGSQVAKKSLPNLGSFSAAQAAVARLVEEARREYRELGARISLLSPGAIDTVEWESYEIDDQEGVIQLDDFLQVFEMVVQSPPIIQFNNIDFQHVSGANV